ncbi:MAG TPA: hypothetical protein V6C82_03960 [Chroococcales cyanobacterium]
MKPTIPLSSISPDDMVDMKVAPGDPYVKAAFDRLSRPTASAKATKMLADAGSADALVIEKAAKKSRSLTFTVQGIMWRAGFAKDMFQTPLGQYTKLMKLPKQGLNDPATVVIRPVGAEFEPVFRELIPKNLIEACEKMYGMVRILDQTALIYFPRDDGAAAGIMATYLDGPASRGHILYLQTNIKNASPTVLDQIQKTFDAALPKAREIASRPSEVDFWKEMEKSIFQVKATFRGSAINQGSKKVKNSVAHGFNAAGSAVDGGIAQVEKVGKMLDILFSLPGRGILWVIQGISKGLIAVITGLDRIFPK